mgnify:CR=1 FL=1
MILTRKCGECRFFKTKTRVGRTFKSCEDLQETRYSEACDSFVEASASDLPIFFPSEFELAVGYREGRRENIAPTVGGAVALALARRFQYDKQAIEAIQRVLIDLQDAGPIVINGVERVVDPSDLKSFQDVVEKLIELVSVKELVYGLGLGDSLDHIMALRTEALFRKHAAPPLAVPARPGATVAVEETASMPSRRSK